LVNDESEQNMAGQVIRVRYNGLVRVMIDRLLEPDEARQIAQEILDCADAAESRRAIDQ
jgi:hypothetical protein